MTEDLLHKLKTKQIIAKRATHKLQCRRNSQTIRVPTVLTFRRYANVTTQTKNAHSKITQKDYNAHAYIKLIIPYK